MTKEASRLYGINVMSAAVDHCEGRDFSGRLYTLYDSEPRQFQSVMDMIHKMDSQFDLWDFPQSASIDRSFRRDHDAADASGIPIEHEAEQGLRKQRLPDYASGLKQYDILEHPGRIGTFIIKVRFRQNATWQGQVHFVEKDRLENFHSVLELIKILDADLHEAL